MGDKPVNLSPRSWLGRALGIALGLVLVGLLLQWAWDLLQPLWPELLSIAVLFLVGRLLLHRYRNF
jgi:hypothetical protein